MRPEASPLVEDIHRISVGAVCFKQRKVGPPLSFKTYLRIHSLRTQPLTKNKRNTPGTVHNLHLHWNISPCNHLVVLVGVAVVVVSVAFVAVLWISERSKRPNLPTTIRLNISHNMAIHVGEILNLMFNVMLIAYAWYVLHHSTCHHPKAQAESPEAERPNIQGPKCEDATYEELQIQDNNTEERVALLVEKAMRPVMQWHDAQKRADEAKITSMKINQHAIMDRQKMFERVTENKLARIKATQLAREVRLDEAEETARTAAKMELTYKHQREVEELRRQLRNQQKKHQKEEARTRGLKNTISKVLGDVERLRIRVQEESRWRKEMENNTRAAAPDVTRLTSEVEDFHASLREEKRRREQFEHGLAVEKESISRIKATVAKLKWSIRATRRLARRKRTDGLLRAISDQISRHAVATFRLHTADPKKPLLPKPAIPDQACSGASPLDDAIDRLSAFSITNSEKKPVTSQQLVVLHPPVHPQQAIIPQQVVIDQPPTVNQQPVLHQPDVEHDSVVRQTTVVDSEPLVDQTSAVEGDPGSEHQAAVDQPLIREPVDKEDPAGGLDIVMKEAPEDEQEPAHDPAPFTLMEPAVIRRHSIEEETVGEKISFVLQQTGQASDVSMSQGNDAMQEPTQQSPGKTVQEETFAKYGVLVVPHVPKPEGDGSQQAHHGAMRVANIGTAGDSSVNPGKLAPSGSPCATVRQQVDEEAENENTSPFHPQPTGPSGSAIGPISGIHWDARPDAIGPKPMIIFGARHILPKPKGKKNTFSTDQIEKTKSKASEAPPAVAGLPPPLDTHFSSEYLARLRVRMADISVMRKLTGDDIDEDADWVVQVRQKDQEFGEAALCNMSEETQYAVPPYTKHMIEQMMESFFLACVWDTLDDEFDLDPRDQEDLRKSFMETVEKHMDTHSADTLPVS